MILGDWETRHVWEAVLADDSQGIFRSLQSAELENDSHVAGAFLARCVLFADEGEVSDSGRRTFCGTDFVGVIYLQMNKRHLAAADAHISDLNVSLQKAVVSRLNS